jgi:HSP20 family protein
MRTGAWIPITPEDVMVRLPMTRRGPRSLFSRPSFGIWEGPLGRLLDEDLFEETGELGWIPATEVVEDEEAITLTAELPGMKREDVKIEVEDDVLRIHGEKREEREEVEEGDGTVRLSERRYGSFSRAFALSGSVDAEEISAAMKDGVLTIRLPKTELARGRTIEIEGD